MTYPPPRVRGLVVAGADAPGLDWAFAQCPDFGREVFADVPDYTHKIVWKNRPRTLDELRAAGRAEPRDLPRPGRGRRAGRRPDRLVGHDGPLPQPRQPPAPALALPRRRRDGRPRRRAGTPRSSRASRALDESVGRLLELASKRDAAVIAVSDHGFGPCKALVNVNGLLRRAGLQRGLMYGTRFRYRAQRLGDRFHRWLTRHAPGGPGRRLPRSIEGQVGCDWKRTVAFAPFGQLSGCIFLNPDDRRQRLGRRPGRRRGHRASAATPATPRPAPRSSATSSRSPTATASTRPPRACPTSSPSRPTATRPRPSGASRSANELLRPDPNLPGDALAATGSSRSTPPTSGPASHLRADLHDVAPTALAMLGLPRPRDAWTGRVLHEAFEHPLPVRYGARPVIEADPEFDDARSPPASAPSAPETRPNPHRTGPRGTRWTRSATIVHDYILREFLPGEDPDELTDETPLITGGILDSISTLKLVVFLEDRFGVTVEAHEAGVENLDSVGQIARLIAEKKHAA